MHAALRLTSSLALLAAALAGSVGCQFLHFVPKPSPTVVADSPFAEPGKHHLRIPPYVFLADFELDGKLPLFRELTNLRDQVSSELHLPVTQKLIRVHLFETRSKYEQYMNTRYPNLPPRRAFFVLWPKSLGGTEELLVYTYWGDRIQQDLRHELTHALLHSVLLNVPMWLDEGLAEYFENPQGWSGINYKHLDQLQRGAPFKPDLDRLETLTEVAQMAAADYREAWAWAHFMLRGDARAKQVLMDFVKELRIKHRPGPLRPRLEAAIPNLEAALLQHLNKLDATKPAKLTAVD